MNRPSTIGNRIHQRPASAGGFTLIELLVVVGILVLLIGILLPTLKWLRVAGYMSNTSARLLAIAQACEQYNSAYNSYPGVLPDSCIITSTTGLASNPIVTSTENCVLALQGGWVAYAMPMTSTINDGLTPHPLGMYNPSNVGLGAWCFNAFSPALTRPYGEIRNLGIPTPNVTGATGGWMAFNTNPLSPGVTDTVIPEFLDCFPTTQLPIIYLRARVGAAGIATASGGVPTQYDWGQVSPYLSTTDVWGGQFPFTGDSGKNNGYASPDAYFVSGTDSSSPVHKDGFILIAAGTDPQHTHGPRAYGTPYDLRN